MLMLLIGLVLLFAAAAIGGFTIIAAVRAAAGVMARKKRETQLRQTGGQSTAGPSERPAAG
ncbi:MAG: hypothetical protein LLG45_12195 [Actinomycetia bacterium]|nr:hypothetical protein [Actinomycetes bacterium]